MAAGLLFYGRRNPMQTVPLSILLAEDNPMNQRVAARMLENWGHSITVVSNGRLALEALERKSFDVVLMDLQMPEMGGFEATALLREREKNTGDHIPVVAMAAFPTTSDQERCLKAGIDEYVFKPFAADELAALLEKYTPWQMSATRQITFHLGQIGGNDPGNEMRGVSGCVVDIARYRASVSNRKENPGVWKVKP
jgi:CheY-like chemotaxis protein